MQQIGQSESQIFEADQNQFLSEYLEYESCPFCSRSFFRGKLAYHLKHCSNQCPMSKNNKNVSKHTKNSLSAATHYERCQNCNCRIPSFLISKHSQFCGKSQQVNARKVNQMKQSAKEIQGCDNCPQDTVFPKIRNYVSQDHTKTSKKISQKSNSPQVIKIRQQLRCLKIAQHVQKIQCEFCGRKFSQKAAQRHVPICHILKQKQRRQIVFNKDSRNATNKKQRTKLEALGKSYDLLASKTFAVKKKMLQSQINEKSNGQIGVDDTNDRNDQMGNEPIEEIIKQQK